MNCFAVCLLAAATILPAIAAPIPYRIDFTIPSDSPVSAPTGSFIYDATSGFSNFRVNWGGATLDFTSVANAPSVALDPPTGCDGAASNHQYGFLIMTQSATNCAAGYGWGGLYAGPMGFAMLNFVLAVGSPEDGLSALATFAGQPDLPAGMGMGTWTVTETPEPGTQGMLLFGALAVALGRVARRR